MATPIRLLLLALTLATTAAIYYPGLAGPFLFDDFHNIRDNPTVQASDYSFESLAIAFNGNDSGFLGRKIPALSFAINFLMGGQQFDVRIFKLTNLAIHLANSLIVFILTIQLSKYLQHGKAHPYLLPFLVALAWAIHPIMLTSVLYVVQRMVTMAAFFVLSSTCLYLHAREGLATGKSWAWPLLLASYGVALVLGGLCKETALLFPLLVISLEITLLNWSSITPPNAQWLRRFLWATLLVPTAIAIVILMARPELLLDTYVTRDFGPVQRILSEARVFWFYLGLIFIPTISKFSLFHDDFVVSQSLIDPITTLPSVIALVGLVVLAVVYRRRHPLACFALFWFLGAHVMESTVIGLELIHEHRNYVAIFGICFALAAAGTKILDRSSLKRLASVFLILVYSTLGFATYTRASIWSDSGRLAQITARHHPKSQRAQLTAAVEAMFRPGELAETYEHIRQAAIVSNAPRPIIEMFKIARWLEIHIDDNEVQKELIRLGPRARQLEHRSTPTYDSPLVVERSYLVALSSALDQEAQWRIRTTRLTPETVNSLDSSGRCVISGNPNCAGLEPHLIRWATLAVEPSTGDPSFRASVAIFAAKLFAYVGDIQAAQEYMEKASGYLPDGAYVKAEKAALLAMLGRRDEARKILQEIVNNDSNRLIDRKNAEKLILQIPE